jgi:hypothetical protein
MDFGMQIAECEMGRRGVATPPIQYACEFPGLDFLDTRWIIAGSSKQLPFEARDIALRNRSLRAGHGCPPSQCPRYGQIVSAVKTETGGQSLSNPGEFYSWLDQTLRQVVGRGFTFDISAKSEDNLSG